MSNSMNPILIRTANKKPCPKNWDFRHSGTSDFFKPQVIHCQKVIAGEKAKIHSNINMYSRPLAMPNNIRVLHNVRAFWIPAWAIQKDWFRYRTNVAFKLGDTFSKHNNCTYTMNNYLVRMFLGDNKFTSTLHIVEGSPDTWPSEANCDIICSVISYDETTILGYACANFTPKGRMLFNILTQLGYEIKWSVRAWASTVTTISGWTKPNFRNYTTWFTKEKNISALALLSYIKVMIDWYTPTQYEEYFEQVWENTIDTQIFIGGGEITDALASLLNWVNYEQDRFTGAWIKPTGPNNEESTITIKDQTINGTNPTSKNEVANITEAQYNRDGTAAIRHINSYSAGSGIISDFILRALNAVQNYTTRNRIAGYRPIDRMLAHFGVHIDYKLIKRSTYITGSSQIFNQNATGNTANTNGDEEIADWMADKGFIGGAGSSMANQTDIEFEWKAEDDGYILIIDTILPRTGYYQGIKHHNLQVDWREQYIPEFDNLGTEAIRRCEIFNAWNGQIPNSQIAKVADNDEMIWGFEPTNAGMKTGYDTLSGDYRRTSINKVGIDVMHTLRKFADDGQNVPDSVSADFIKGSTEEYLRIFQYTGQNADHFNFTAITTDKGTGPWESISESLPITDGEGQMAKYNYGGSTYMN